ncbi:MAG: glycosyltransferase family protein [Candidatus Omnitrophica bacterium]|nr:glycosyltransferase family protein [Candidatus Omnitrophota bacterium]
MKNIIALIQARTGARRLPNKVLLPLGGKTVLECVMERVSRSQLVDEVAVVTTVAKDDLKIIERVSRNNVRVLCGSENDVLDRYYQAARLLEAKHIVRITADCPLIDPALMDHVISAYLDQQAHYCSNALTQTFPDGLDVEVFSFEALKRAWQNAKLPSEREHVTPYIRTHKRMFKVVSIESSRMLGQHRWTLDEKNDYEFIKKIYQALYAKKPQFGFEDVLLYLKKNPSLLEINSGIVRNEGYAKSLKDDEAFVHG